MYMKNKDERTSRAQHIHTHVQVGENILEMPSESSYSTNVEFFNKNQYWFPLNLLWKLTCSSSHLSGPNKFSNIIALRYEP